MRDHKEKRREQENQGPLGMGREKGTINATRSGPHQARHAGCLGENKTQVQIESGGPLIPDVPGEVLAVPDVPAGCLTCLAEFHQQHTMLPGHSNYRILGDDE